MPSSFSSYESPPVVLFGSLTLSTKFIIEFPPENSHNRNIIFHYGENNIYDRNVANSGNFPLVSQ